MVNIKGRITKLEFFSEDQILISMIQERDDGSVRREDLTITWDMYERVGYKLRDPIEITLK